MIRSVFIAGFVALALGPAVAWSQVDLSWGNCVVAAPGETTSTLNQDFCCDTSNEYTLYGCCKVPTTLTNITGVQVFLDFQTPNASALSPFWHFEASFQSEPGCNRLGSAVSARKIDAGGCSRKSATIAS